MSRGHKIQILDSPLLRWRVVRVKEGGAASHVIAQHLNVPRSTVRGIWRQFNNRKCVRCRNFQRARTPRIYKFSNRKRHSRGSPATLTRPRLQLSLKQGNRTMERGKLVTVDNHMSTDHPIVGWILKTAGDIWLRTTVMDVVNREWVKRFIAVYRGRTR